MIDIFDLSFTPIWLVILDWSPFLFNGFLVTAKTLIHFYGVLNFSSHSTPVTQIFICLGLYSTGKRRYATCNSAINLEEVSWAVWNHWSSVLVRFCILLKVLK